MKIDRIKEREKIEFLLIENKGIEYTSAIDKYWEDQTILWVHTLTIQWYQYSLSYLCHTII